ncbi:hypothetical protein HYS03_01180 [Candidatus Woesebacteria bacterium]|nr:hypothetical protein [Candidatus Woesebacteria bacterium]QQG47776.1 MAG: hypothetical protein HY044_01660 [Candidatus Woesebacteria bacterium]
MKDEDLETAEGELAWQEGEKYEKSGTKDSYEIWKLKKFINERFIEAIVVSAIVTLIILKFL